mgnify:CR=1 FL=1
MPAKTANFFGIQGDNSKNFCIYGFVSGIFFSGFLATTFTEKKAFSFASRQATFFLINSYSSGLCLPYLILAPIIIFLNSDKSIDIKRTKELIELSKPLSFTFHRALDEVANPKEALEQLINLGVERVLTSGQKPSAEEGLSLLKKLNEIANGKITILAGGGINAQNAVKFKEAGLKEIHASASITINQDDSLFCLPQTVSDTNTIKDILDAI